jgi:hypothetical protein
MNANEFNALMESAYQTFLNESGLAGLPQTPADGIIYRCFKAGFVFGVRAGVDRTADALNTSLREGLHATHD